MTRQSLFYGFVAAVMWVVSSPLAAHHSRAMFDMSKKITYRGFVKEYRWQNPHCHIVIMVGTDETDRSTTGTWDVEASSIGLMESQGWNLNSFRSGDRITVVAHPSRSGSRDVLLYYAIRPDGTQLYRAQHRYPLESE